MPDDQQQPPRSKCNGCGFEAESGSDQWEAAEHPSLGTLTRCPECGGTDVHSRA